MDRRGDGGIAVVALLVLVEDRVPDPDLVHAVVEGGEHLHVPGFPVVSLLEFDTARRTGRGPPPAHPPRSIANAHALRQGRVRNRDWGLVMRRCRSVSLPRSAWQRRIGRVNSGTCRSGGRGRVEWTYLSRLRSRVPLSFATTFGRADHPAKNAPSSVPPAPAQGPRRLPRREPRPWTPRSGVRREEQLDSTRPQRKRGRLDFLGPARDLGGAGVRPEAGDRLRDSVASVLPHYATPAASRSPAGRLGRR